MCDLYNEETSSVWTQTQRAARKEHLCDCCRKTIRVGEKHIYGTSLYDGHWSSERICLACNADRKEFAADPHHRMTPAADSFKEYLEQCIGDGDPGYEKWQHMLGRINDRAVCDEDAK